MDGAKKYPLDKYKWYHKIQVDENTYTPSTRKNNVNPHTIKHFDNIDFNGKKVLDIGCRDGFYCFEAEKRGAKEILGIDTCLSLGAVDFLIPHFKSKVKMEEKSIYDIDGEFDVIIFAGVLYHLKYPFLALKKISESIVDGGHLIIETAIWQNKEEKSLLWCPKVEEAPNGPTSLTFFNYKGLKDNLELFGFDFKESNWIPSKVDTGDIGRTTITCVKNKNLDKNLDKYWDGQPHKNWQL